MSARGVKKGKQIRTVMLGGLVLMAMIMALEQNLSQTLLDMAFARAYSMAVETLNRAVHAVTDDGVSYKELVDTQMDA